MADLVDRLTGLSEFMTPPRPHILIHEFQAHFNLYGAGKWTGAEAQIGLDLQGDELTQMQAIITKMESKNSTQKIAYALVVQGVALALSHAPALNEPIPNIYFSWNGNQLIVDKARVALDLEL